MSRMGQSDCGLYPIVTLLFVQISSNISILLFAAVVPLFLRNLRNRRLLQKFDKVAKVKRQGTTESLANLSS